jgi:hypothetical protein
MFDQPWLQFATLVWGFIYIDDVKFASLAFDDIERSAIVDGQTCVEGPDHEIDWPLADDEFNAYAVEMLKASDVLIMGRNTYELWQVIGPPPWTMIPPSKKR